MSYALMSAVHSGKVVDLSAVAKWKNSQKYFYEKLLADPTVQDIILNILEFTRALSYENKIFFRQIGVLYAVELFAERHTREISQKLSSLSRGKFYHKPDYYEDVLKERSFLTSVKNLLLLAVGATISPEEDVMDTEYWQAWYQRYVSTSRLWLGDNFYTARQPIQLYYRIGITLLEACLMFKNVNSDRVNAARSLGKLYKSALPKAANQFGLRQWHAKSFNEIVEPSGWEAFLKELERSRPEAKAHFESSLIEAHRQYLVPASADLMYFGIIPVCSWVLPLIIGCFFCRNETDYAKLLGASILAVVISVCLQSFAEKILIQIEKMMRCQILGHFSLAAVTPLVQSSQVQAESALLPIKSAASAKPVLDKETLDKEAIKVSQALIPVMDVSGYNVQFEPYIDGGVVKGVTRKVTRSYLERRNRGGDFAVAAPVAQVMQVVRPVVEPFGIKIKDRFYFYCGVKPCPDDASEIVLNERKNIPTFYAIQADLADSKELLVKLRDNDFEAQVEGEVLAIKPQGDRRLYAVKIETGVADRALYLVTHEGRHTGAGKIPSRTLEFANGKAPLKKDIEILSSEVVRERLSNRGPVLSPLD